MYPRTISLGVLLRDDHILVEEREGYHSKGQGKYYRLIGGTIEIGEHSQETLVREFYEELKVEIVITRYIKCLENIFRINEDVGHELVQLYLVEFKDHTLYEREYFEVVEGKETTLAKWIPVHDVITGNKTLFPNGLAELLKNELK